MLVRGVQPGAKDQVHTVMLRANTSLLAKHWMEVITICLENPTNPSNMVNADFIVACVWQPATRSEATAAPSQL